MTDVTEIELFNSRANMRDHFSRSHWPADVQAWNVDWFRREGARRRSAGWQIAYVTIYTRGLEP